MLLLAACTNTTSLVGPTGDASTLDLGAADGSADVTCSAGQTACGSACVSIATDTQNCGQCGRACGNGETCQNGGCVPTCSTAETLCGSADAGLTCVNLNTDSRNCGICGRACDRDRVCSGGVCTFMCSVGLTECTRGTADADGGTERYCANITNDRANCGACGNTCLDGYACEAGRCRLRCDELRTACPDATADAGVMGGGEFCTNVSNDIRNCGACGNACPFGQLCSSGTCATMCGAGLTNCNSVCSNVRTDRENCGMCGNACAAGEVCTAGTCVISCSAGLTDCMGACRDLSNDLSNCGACGMACAAGQVCSGGMCRVSCGGGTTNCSGTCRDLATDTAHCGMCDLMCPAGQICSGGMCRVSCGGGTTNCMGACRDLQTDRLNCGACGRACGSGQICTAGSCVVSCPTGQTNCSGTCRDLQNDTTNCGTCGRVCASGQVCSAGTCSTTCASPLTNCANVCVDPRNDPSNCGTCGRVCAFANATAACASSACIVASCNPNFGNCDNNATNGCEQNLQTSTAHCGACGRACASGQTCVSGVCTTPCPSGQTLCSGACVDLQTNGNNCGSCGRVCSTSQTCISGSCVNANGTVLSVTGTTIPVLFVLCGNGTNTNCTEAVARSSCTNIGRQLVSHASNGINGVSTLGATASCYWSISYFTNSSTDVAGQCLIGVSNAQWSSCCTLSQWHGNTVRVPSTLGQQFGYTSSNDTGYRSNLSNTAGTQWGCVTNATAASALSGCSRYYVACR